MTCSRMPRNPSGRPIAAARAVGSRWHREADWSPASAVSCWHRPVVSGCATAPDGGPKKSDDENTPPSRSSRSGPGLRAATEDRRPPPCGETHRSARADRGRQQELAGRSGRLGLRRAAVTSSRGHRGVVPPCHSPPARGADGMNIRATLSRASRSRRGISP